MKLLLEGSLFSKWLLRVLGKFLEISPAATLAVIILTSIGNICRILSFLLPLKVVILAGSEGVPRYFPFIDPGDKSAWIFGLATMAVICYLAALILESLVRRLSLEAGQIITRAANKMKVMKNQEETTQEYYADFCLIWSNLIFLGVSTVVLLLINPGLLLFLVVLTSLQALFSFQALRGDDFSPGPLKAYIMDRTGDYLKILSSISFLSSFLVILFQLLKIGAGNILTAIIAVVIVRRSLKFAVDTIRTAVKLNASRQRIDTLIFPEIQVQKSEGRGQEVLRDLFHKQARQDAAREEVCRAVSMEGPVEATWIDSPVRGVYMFHILIGDVHSESKQHFQLQVFHPKFKYLLENEDFLFKHVPRKSLHASPLAGSFNRSSFKCRIYDFGLGIPPDNNHWKESAPKLLEDYWLCQPPSSLIKAYRTSHMSLHERLDDEFVCRIEVAVDTIEERSLFREFKARLPEIRNRIAATPLYFYNPEIFKKNLAVTEDGSVYAMTWGRWSLEPVGSVVLSELVGASQLEEMIERMKQQRNDVPSGFDIELVRLVNHSRKVEKDIARRNYKSALKKITGLL